MAEERPVRYCHKCKDYDDHPRLTHVEDMNRPDLDKLYHYDCAPPEAITDVHAPILEARESGKRGLDLAEFVTEYAATIEEAPADKTSKKGDA